MNQMNHFQGRFLNYGLLCVLFLSTLLSTAISQETKQEPAGTVETDISPWTLSSLARYTKQFDSDLDSGGGFRADRAYTAVNLSYAFEKKRTVSFSLGYGFGGYDFYGQSGLAGLTPWKNIHSTSLSMPVRWTLDDERWTLFAVPTLRSSAEEGASFSSSIHGGGFLGLSYYIDEHLTIGSGIGVLSQIEDNPRVFPVLLIDWKISETLSLGTGRGEGATLGPGLFLTWQPDIRWSLSIGGRYEKFRFRLDDEGTAPRGVGEDRTFPLLISATCNLSRQAQINLSGGLLLGGRLRLEDEEGHEIDEQDYDPAPFFGATFRYRF
jgi:hypothetical protein